MNAEIFNENVPVGTPVTYQSVAGDPSTARETKTRTPAWELGHGATVVSVEGVSGGVSISHVIVHANQRPFK